MDALGDLLDPDAERPAVASPARASRPISLGEFTRTARKTGNYLRHLGVGRGVTVAVADDRAPEPLYALFGAALLGATVRFGSAGDDWRVLVGPTADVVGRSAPPGATRVAYGDPPSDPSVAHFGTDVWSENPAFPEGDVTQDDPLLVVGERAVAHGDLLDAAGEVVERAELTDDDRVAVRASLARPGTVAAGVVAPLLAGATVLLPGDGSRGTVTVTDGDAPEGRVVRPGDLL